MGRQRTGRQDAAHQGGPGSGSALAQQSASSLVVTSGGSDSLRIPWVGAVGEPLVLGRSLDTGRGRILREESWDSRFTGACTWHGFSGWVSARAKAFTWREPSCPKSPCFCLTFANCSQDLGFCSDPGTVNLLPCPKQGQDRSQAIAVYSRCPNPLLTLRSSSPESMTCRMEGREKEKSASQ